MQAPDFWRRDGLVPRLLDPLGRSYGLIGTIRRRLIAARRAPIPVICVGNLTVGGAGKTPTAIAVARRLQELGRHPHLLLRGYGGRVRGPLRVDLARQDAAEVGDEALLLARIAPAWVSRDRVAGAAAAAAAGADVLVMDDGLQNPYLAHDLALAVVDGAVGFGNGRLLPAGPLREPVAPRLARVDALVLVGDDEAGVAAALPPGLTRLDADLTPLGHGGGFARRRVLAFAGIGRPDKFFKTLHDLGAEVVRTRSFPDHRRYRRSEVEALLDIARRLDAACVTTEKDHVRLPADLAKHVETLPIALSFRRPGLLDRLLVALARRPPAGGK